MAPPQHHPTRLAALRPLAPPLPHRHITNRAGLRPLRTPVDLVTDLETLALAAALLLALAALLTGWAAHRHLHTTTTLVANLRAETTELHRARNLDAARLNQLYAWAHGATPAPEVDPDPEPEPIRADPRDLPPPPDRRTTPDRRRGAHRPPDATTQMPRQPGGERPRIDEHPEKEAVYPNAPERSVRP
jgi:hypothetical protein